jgi:tol-pal system protein YbgF
MTMHRLRHFACIGCLAAALAAAGCVSPQDIEALQSQLSDIQRQMLQLQRQAPSKQEVEDLGTSVGQQMGSLLKTEADMQVKLQELSSQIDELQAKLEDTNYRLAQLSQQIATTNQELKAFRSQPPAPAPAPADPATGQNGEPGAPPAQQPQQPSRPGPAADPQSLYNAAYNDYLRGKYDLALQGFEEYLKNFPGTDLADNATYWIGECYYRQRRYRQAVDQFEAVLSRYPRSDKSAGALLKKGYALIELGDRSQGVTQLRQVLRQYPTSDEANLARQRLRELGVDAS